MSITERMPPPTVSGMKQQAAVRRTTSTMVARPSEEAVMSRKTSSSACWASYALAHSTGSPASLRLTKLVPLTTLPSVTSRHGMILFASTALSSHHRQQRESLKYGLPQDAYDGKKRLFPINIPLQAFFVISIKFEDNSLNFNKWINV